MPGKLSRMRSGSKVVKGFVPNAGARMRGSKAGDIAFSNYSTAIKINQMVGAGVTIKELKSIDAPKSLVTAYEKRLKFLLKKR